jgi:hypothetical protein
VTLLDGKPFKQADRLATDGDVQISAMGDERLLITVISDGRIESIICSKFNASRVFGLLSLMLGINLPANVGGAINLR